MLGFLEMVNINIKIIEKGVMARKPAGRKKITKDELILEDALNEIEPEIQYVSYNHELEHPYVKVFDVTINVYGSRGKWEVEVIHKPTGKIIREKSVPDSIHQNRLLAMRRLNDEIAHTRNQSR